MSREGGGAKKTWQLDNNRKQHIPGGLIAPTWTAAAANSDGGRDYSGPNADKWLRALERRANDMRANYNDMAVRWVGENMQNSTPEDKEKARNNFQRQVEVAEAEAAAAKETVKIDHMAELCITELKAAKTADAIPAIIEKLRSSQTAGTQEHGYVNAFCNDYVAHKQKLHEAALNASAQFQAEFKRESTRILAGIDSLLRSAEPTFPKASAGLDGHLKEIAQELESKARENAKFDAGFDEVAAAVSTTPKDKLITVAKDYFDNCVAHTLAFSASAKAQNNFIKELGVALDPKVSNDRCAAIIVVLEKYQTMRCGDASPLHSGDMAKDLKKYGLLDDKNALSKTVVDAKEVQATMTPATPRQGN